MVEKWGESGNKVWYSGCIVVAKWGGNGGKGGGESGMQSGEKVVGKVME